MRVNRSVGIITGASRGIGKAAALMLGREGAKLVLNSRASQAELNEVVEQLQRNGSRAVAVLGDVSRYEDCRRIVQAAIDHYGSVDFLVNNAGIFGLKRLVEMQPEDWEQMFKVHVFGAFNMIRHVLPHMLDKRSGVIVNVSSFVALRPPGVGRTHYAAAKAALIGLTKSLSLEVAPSGVRVVAVAPGLTRTEMALRGIPNLEQRMKLIPMGRIGEPEEMAHTIKYAIENDFITGETIVVSGGE